jgi:hypothetical protein
MKFTMENKQVARRVRWAATIVGLVTLVPATACNDVLEVDLPAELTDEALNDPAGATTQLNTVIVEFEGAFNEFFWTLHGREDGAEIVFRSPGVAQTTTYDPRQLPFNQFSRSLHFATSLHDNLENNWTAQQVPGRARYLAITSIYQGAALSWLGSSLCEVTIEAGPKLTPSDVYAKADAALTRALQEIEASGGDFALPFTISSSAKNMAYGLRAQVRWMAGNRTGALDDAQRVPTGFMAYVTREARPGRRNLAFEAGNGTRFARLLDVNDWWKGAPNPVTNRPWPNPIPFTGFTNLGILPDGRAVRDDGLPIRTAGNYRTAIESTAVPDTRVKSLAATVQGIGLPGQYVNAKYSGEGSPIALVNWRDLWLIRAELEGGQKAIDLVNEIRRADQLPVVTYASPTNAEQIRYMILEERRRALFLEGRFFFTKLKNLDVLWFPRGEGALPTGGQFLLGGIRFVMPESEYQLNPNLTPADQATGCDARERPKLVG